MKNRIVRWTIYLIIGVAIGVGVNYFNKQNKIDKGVVELSPDEVTTEDINIPSRFSETMDNVAEDLEDAGAALEESGEAMRDAATDAMENLGEMMPSDNAAEEMAPEAPEAMPEDAQEIDPTLTPMPQ